MSTSKSSNNATRRSQLRQQLTVAWMRKNKPGVFKAIEEYAAAKHPYSDHRGVPPTTVLPTELANLI